MFKKLAKINIYQIILKLFKMEIMFCALSQVKRFHWKI